MSAFRSNVDSPALERIEDAPKIRLRSRSLGRSEEVIRVVVLFGLVLASYLPTLLQHFIGNPYGDFGLHVEWVEDLAAGRILRPHFLFHATTLIVWRVLPWLDVYTAAIVVTIGFNFLLAFLIYRTLPDSIPFVPRLLNDVAKLGLPVAMLLVGPISLLTWPNRYLGYIGINPTHSPTIVALKPFALLLFVYGYRFLTRRGASARTILACLAVTVLGTLAKPSFLIAFVPVLCLAALWRWTNPATRSTADWRGLALGVVVPGAALLLCQYWFEYGNPKNSAVVFAPMREFGASLDSVRPYARMQLGVPSRLLLSCLFPAAVLTLYFKRARVAIDLMVAWGSFAVGVGYFLLLMETDKAGHGNFGWSAQITLFVLFYASLLFFLARAGERVQAGFWTAWREIVCLAAFGLHLASGMLFVRYPYLL